jgi:A/G-specific adenine glycosylase
MNITRLLLHWFNAHARILAWKEDHAPYKIWVSEILLQQTRVSQANAYYSRFLHRFPTIQALANAPLDDVLRLWQGLGYYSRARNMHAAARQIVTEYGGCFPSTPRELQQLKGVGSYTAAAVAAFAFNYPIVALDGNALRILSRIFGEDSPIDNNEGRKIFETIAAHILPPGQADVFNQALMDFGSLVCTPSPKCADCPLPQYCQAWLQNRVHELPVKRKKTAPRHRYFSFLYIRQQDHIYIQQRKHKDIWQGLYQFPLIETPQALSPEQLQTLPEWADILDSPPPPLMTFSPEYTHKLTHQTLHAHFVRLHIEKESSWLLENCQKIHINSLDNFGIPRLLERYLSDSSNHAHTSEQNNT